MLRALLLFLISPVFAQTACLEEQWLRDRSVLIQKAQKGKGSGVIWDANHVLTAWHVVEDLPIIWLRPQGHLLRAPHRATVIDKDIAADVALLKLEKPIPKAISTPLAPAVTFSQTAVLSGYRHGDSSRFDVIPGRVKVTNVTLANGPTTHTLYKLSQWAYSGHSGGGIYTCEGELLGIETASKVLSGQQDEVVGTHLDVLKQVLQPLSVMPAKAGIHDQNHVR